MNKITATRKDKIAVFFLFSLFAFCIYLQFIAGMAGDKDGLLFWAHKWLQGKKLYVDIVDVNPPLIIWIYALPAYVSHYITFAEDFHILTMFGLCIAAVSIKISSSIIKQHPQFSGHGRKQWQFICLLIFVFIFFYQPMYFFDRENIFFILVFPYIVRFMPSIARMHFSLYLRLLIGCMAGIGFCIKPHCLIVFVGLQLMYFLREGGLRILISSENLLIYTIGACYLFAIWQFAPAYYLVVFPMVLATYSAYSFKLNNLYYGAMALLVFGITAADFRWRYASPYRKDIFYFLQLCVFMLAYALVNNGWGYTWNPLISSLLVMTGFVWWEHLYLKQKHISQGLPAKQFTFGANACAFNFFINAVPVIVTGYMIVMHQCTDDRRCINTSALVQEMQERHVRSFGAMAMHYDPLLAVYRQTGATLETRFNHLWMLPKYFLADDAFRAAHSYVPEYVAHAFAEDMNRNRPDIMLVDMAPGFPMQNDKTGLLDFFTTYPDFKDAWRSYRYVKTINYCPAIAGIKCPFAFYERLP